MMVIIRLRTVIYAWVRMTGRWWMSQVLRVSNRISAKLIFRSVWNVPLWKTLSRWPIPWSSILGRVTLSWRLTIWRRVLIRGGSLNHRRMPILWATSLLWDASILRGVETNGGALIFRGASLRWGSLNLGSSWNLGSILLHRGQPILRCSLNFNIGGSLNLRSTSIRGGVLRYGMSEKMLSLSILRRMSMSVLRLNWGGKFISRMPRLCKIMLIGGTMILVRAIPRIKRRVLWRPCRQGAM